MTRFRPLLLSLILPAAPALSCSCDPQNDGGFVHAAITHLPANARGALFKIPLGKTIVAQDGNNILYRELPLGLFEWQFSIQEGANTEPLPVKIEPVKVAGKREREQSHAYIFPVAADLDAYFASAPRPSFADLFKEGKLVDITDQVKYASGLVRIAPRTGFRSGATYTITYNGIGVDWDKLKVTYTIDAEAVDTDSQEFRLALDNLPTRQLLERPESGTCSSSQPSLVQDFRFVAPASYAAYRSALSYYSYRQTGKNGEEVPNDYYRALCDTPRFATTARGDGEDFVAADCAAPAEKITISGSVGFLEVEDTLHETGSITTDMSRIRGTACTASGIMKDALKSGDMVWTERTLCQFAQRHVDHWAQPPVVETPPPLGRLLSLHLAPPAQSCLLDVLTEFGLDNPAARERMIALFRQQLLSPESDVRARAGQKLERMLSGPGQQAAPRDRHRQQLFAGLVDTVVDGFLQYHDNYRGALKSFLHAAGPAASRTVPRLQAAIESGSPDSIKAIDALAGGSSDNAALRAFLQKCMATPALYERAVLAYAEISGPANRPRAVEFLSRAAKQGSSEAVNKLGDMGRSAKASLPLLLELLRSEQGEYRRQTVLEAIMQVGTHDMKVIAIVNDTLASPNEREANIVSSAIGDLSTKANDVPALRSLLVECAKKPGLLNAAAIKYADIANDTVREQEVELLARATANGSEASIEKLRDLGSKATASLPVLLDVLRHGKNKALRNRALYALAWIAPSDTSLTKAVNEALAVPDAEAIDIDSIDLYASNLTSIEPLLPGLKVSLARLRQATDADGRDMARAAIERMRWSESQKRELLQLLD